MDIPGLEDRGALLAAFSGAVAYLCTQDKLPVLTAVAYVVAGTVAAAYITPGLAEWIAASSHAVLSDKSKNALTFITGVSGIWLLNIIVTVLQAASKRSDDFITALLNRVFNTNKSSSAPAPAPLEDDKDKPT